MTSLISSIVWVPRGAAARHPRRYDLSDPAEVARVEKIGKIKLDDARRDLEEYEKLEQQEKMEMDGDDDDGQQEDDDDGQDEAAWEDEDDDDVTKKATALAKSKAASTATAVATSKDDLSQYNLDDYDEEVARSAATGAFGNIKGLSYYAAGKEDPYVTLTNPNQEDAELEKEELEILPTDNLVVSAKTADEVPLLEVHVYENPDAAPASSPSQDYEGNLYVHHDTLMPAMALCLEWGDVRPSTSAQKAQGNKGNFVAVGTMDHQIEIWDLDLVDGLIPEVILGDDSDLPPIKEEEEAKPATLESTPAEESMEVDSSAALASGIADVDLSSTSDKKKKKKKKKSKTVKPALSVSQPAASTSSPYTHTDSVLALAWNRTHRNLLASSSADGTIKLWDVSSPTCQRALRSFSLHTKSDKIQALQWNPKEHTVLIAGSWKGEIKIFDTRSPESALTVVLPNNADVEVLRWDPLSTTGAEFYVASGSGQVLYYDSKDLSKPVWTLDAHQGPTAALDINPFIPGCFVTGGIDKQVKIWNVSSAPGAGSKRSISLVVSRDFSLGKVFSCLWSPDDPTIVAMGGSNAKLNIWDTWTNPGFRKTFGERIKQLNRDSYKEGSAREKAKGITQIEDDQDDMSGDE